MTMPAWISTEAFNTLLGVVVGAVLTGVGAAFRQYWSYRKELRESRRDERRRLMEIYSNCIYYLRLTSAPFPSPEVVPAGGSRETQLERFRIEHEAAIRRTELTAERDRWLDLLQIHFPPIGDDEQSAFAGKLQASMVNVLDVRRLAAADPRLKP